MKLVVGHCLAGTLEPVDMLGFRKSCPGRTGNPYTFPRMVALGHVVVAGVTVRVGVSSLLESYDLIRIFG